MMESAAKRGGTDKTPPRRIEWDTRGGCAGTARRTGRPAGGQAFVRGRKELFHKLRGGFSMAEIFEEGIDVSRYQGTIEWSACSLAKKR